MKLTKNKLYAFLFLACLVGYSWLFINYRMDEGSNSLGVCLVKHVTTIPCPSCGSTRSVLAILKGNFSEALFLNPIGFIIFNILLIAPLWIAFDMLFRKDTLFAFYNRMEDVLKRKVVFIPAILLILGNWIWNIYKGL